jgi:hypothetical protein
VTTFVFGLPSILAVIINCMNQNDACGTFLESHCRGQIRSVWFEDWDRRRSGRMRPGAVTLDFMPPVGVQ